LFKPKGEKQKVPIKRKVCKIGNGFAVFLPKSWVILIEENYGCKVEAVTMEVDGQLIIEPILKERKNH
jgi:antitoxin component of MazEF toxin-antitoxin module